MAKNRRVQERMSGSTTTYTYILLFEAAKFAIKEAKVKHEGSFYHSLHCIVATAFGLEAFLNDVGDQMFRFWPSLKWLSPDEKLKVICTELRFDPDFGTRPYQSFRQAFHTRNLAAHSETVTSTFDRPAPSRNKMPRPERTPLESACTTAKADRVFSDALLIVKELHKRAGLRGNPLVIATHTSYVQA